MMKQTLVAFTAIALTALTLVQTASAMSVFAHNENVPPGAAQVAYTINDHRARYAYAFHKFLTLDRPDVELPLPSQFQTYDRVTVALDMSSPFEKSQTSDAGILGDLGVDAWFDLSEQ